MAEKESPEDQDEEPSQGEPGDESPEWSAPRQASVGGASLCSTRPAPQQETTAAKKEPPEDQDEEPSQGEPGDESPEGEEFSELIR